MKGLVWVLCLGVAMACNNSKQQGKDAAEPDNEGTAFDYETFSNRFENVAAPYGISDTTLLKNKDTAAIRSTAFASFIPDSVRQKLVGKGGKVQYIPMARLEVPKGETYFVIKAVSGSRKAALLAVFDKNQSFSAAFPFLVPDKDATTSQSSMIDKAFTVYRNVSQKGKDDVMIEGKDVYVYNDAAHDFTLIMTDLLDDGTGELINPIDTLTRLHKLSGDYVKGKRNIVSIRDGRNANELMAFVHFEKEDGECTGEVKGNLLLTSSTTAVYRQGGDPCVLEFTFGASSVTLHEVEGCGSRRDLQCTFDGTYPKKKVASDKTAKGKPAKKKAS